MSDWRALFAAPAAGEAGRTWPLRVLRRRGHDLLVLPAESRAAARALTLYAAQSRPARWAKALLRTALASGLPVPLARTDLTVAPQDPLLQWLQEMTGEAEPLFAILAGNPFALGRRFVVLAFRQGEPAIVIKLGGEPDARALIEREADFLAAQAAFPHLPAGQGTRREAAWSGLALQFIDGQSPEAADTAGLRTVLREWLDPRPVALDTLAPWQRLAAHPGARGVVERLAGRSVAPALFHGDFAPWNVRVEKATGRWTVIDWERGKAAGVPGWDWFHWMIHVSVLVHRHATPESVAFLEAALSSSDFQVYAAEAGIAGWERTLLAAYLIHLDEFIIPPEIKDPIGRLRTNFQQ